MQYVADNVFQNNDALGLKTSAYPGTGPIKTAEIDSQRDDILYGTFRMVAQIPSVPGATFGFFTYKGDSQEQDIEFIHEQNTDYFRTVHYTNQPSLLPNGNVDPDATKTVVLNNVDFTNFTEHRLDWLPDRILFYYKGAQTSTIMKHVPNIGSHIILNVWSNGDPQWAGLPPTQDAIATIQNVHLYFNSTGLSEATFNAACANARNPPPCAI